MLNVRENFGEFSTSSTNYLTDPTRGVVEMVLRSDSERFDEELVATGKSLKQHVAVIERHKSVVRERDEVSDCSVP